MTPTPDTVRRRVAELVSAASLGAVSAPDALAGAARLGDLGLDSLGLLRLVDALELEYGVELDLADPRLRLDSVEAIVAHLIAQPGRPA